MPEGAPERRFATWLLGLSIFATGFCGLVSEFILSTVSTYILGNSIEQFSVIIALMMAMMGLAGALQRFFPDRRLVEQFIAVETLLALLGGFAPIAIYAGYGFLDSHFLLVLYFFAAAIGFLIGFELPLVLRINAALGRKLPTNLAVILGLDYVGGFVGALVWTRFLLRELPLTEISFLIAGVNFAIASVTFLYFTWPRESGSRGVRALGWLATAVVGGCLLLGYTSNRDWSLQLEQRLYDDRVVFSETTRYQRIVLTHDPVRDDHRLFLEGIRSILDREIGLEVHASVGKGVELLNLLKTTRADVVLTDIRMPGMDGLSLTRQICRSFPNTRVIALTMLDHEQDVKDLLDAGARGYLVKNVEKEELVQAIHTVARGDYYLSRKFRPIYKNWKSQEPRQESVRLTRRERQVLELIAQGRTSQQIAESLKLSRFTIDTHRKNIHKKMGIRSNIGLLKAASKWLGQAPQDTDNRQ